MRPIKVSIDYVCHCCRAYVDRSHRLTASTTAHHATVNSWKSYVARPSTILDFLTRSQLDADVNPDPFHELPPAPPTRPGEEIDRWYPPENEHEHGSNGPMEGNFMSSLFGNMFGATVGDPHGQGNVAGAGPNRPSSAPSGSRSGGRSFQFNMPGGGRGQVVFGSFNGGAGGDPFGNTGTNSYVVVHRELYWTALKLQ